MKKTIISAFVLLMLSSCAAFHAGTMENSASLSQANFDYVQKDVVGKANATYIFGFGGFAKQRIADQAKQDLLSNIKLKNNQALANITVNYKSKYIFGFIYHQMTCSITADVVEFKK